MQMTFLSQTNYSMAFNINWILDTESHEQTDDCKEDFPLS